MKQRYYKFFYNFICKFLFTNYSIKYKNNGNSPIDYRGLEISHHNNNNLYDNIEPFIKASNDTSEAYAKLLNDNIILIEGYDSKHKVAWICITQSGL